MPFGPRTGSRNVDHLIIKSLQGTATPQEQDKLRAWRHATDENERHYREVSALWRMTGTRSRSAGGPRPDAASIISAAEGCRTPTAAPLRRRFCQAAALAAALVTGLLIGDAWLGFQWNAAPALEAAEFVTGPAQLATARLSDGTVVRLAPSTRLRVGDRDDRREVWLDGKAFFAVTPDERAPFTVRTRAGEALVHGTRFEVDVSNDDFQVLVVEGKVEMGADGHRVEIDAGYVSRAGIGTPPEVSLADDVATHLDWMGPFLAFENTPLRQVAAELEVRYPIKVEIADSILETRTVTAWFGDEDPEAVLTVICRIADVHCAIRNGIASIEP